MTAPPSPALIPALTTALAAAARRYAFTPALASGLLDTLLANLPPLDSTALVDWDGQHITRRAWRGVEPLAPAVLTAAEHPALAEALQRKAPAILAGERENIGIYPVLISDAPNVAHALLVRLPAGLTMPAAVDEALQTAASVIGLALSQDLLKPGAAGLPLSALPATPTRQILWQTERLYSASQALRDAGSVEETLAVLQSLLAADYAPSHLDIYLLVEDTFQHLHHWHADGADWPGDSALAEIDLAQAFDHPACYVENATSAPETDALPAVERLYLAATDGQALISLPLYLRDKVIGRLLMALPVARHFLPDERNYLVTLADQATMIINNWTLLRQTQGSLEEARILYEAASRIADVSSVQDMLTTLARAAAASEVSAAQLFLLHGRGWDRPEAEVEIAAVWSQDGSLPDLSGMRFTAAQYPHWPELATPTLLAIDDIATDARLSEESRLSYLALGIAALVVAPLEMGGTPAGALLFGAPHPRRYSPRELRIYQNLAEMATISLQNLRLLRQTQHRARQLQTSAQVSRDAISILDVNVLLPRIVNLIRDSFQYDHVQIFLLDDARENAVLKASTGEAGQILLSINWSLPVGSNSVIGQVTARAEPVIALDTSDARVIHRPNPYLPDTRSEMALPLISRGQVLGALDVQSRQPGAFTDEDVAILTSLADQIAIALANARLFEQTQRYTEALSRQVLSLQSLLEASQGLATLLDADEILNAAARYLAAEFKVDHVGIATAMEQNPELGIVRAEYPDTGTRGIVLPLEGTWWTEVYRSTRQPVVVPDVRSSPLLDEATRGALLGVGINELVLVPFLTHDEHVLGSIGLDIYAGGREFTTEELTLIQLFATQVTTAYRNAQLFARTQQQAEDMAFLFNVTTLAAETPGLEASMETVVNQLRGVLPADAVGVYLASPGGDSLQRVAAHCNPGYAISERIPLTGWIARQALRERRPFLLPDLHDLVDGPGIIATNLRSLIAAPLLSGNTMLGLIVLFKEETGVYHEGNLRLLQALAGSISAVVQNIRLLEEVQAANVRLRELDKVKSQFLANMSHELRTPLNSIIGFSRVILKGIDGPLTDLQRQDLETIHASGQHLLNLINDILDQAKIEADKLALTISEFDLRPVIEAARSMSVGLLKDKAVRLHVELEDNLPRVWGDEIRTRQVLLNLLSNAAKFTHEGSITISAFNVQREDGPYIQVSVTDTGIGIPEDKQETIFIAFEQVDGSLTRASGGTGLGLPISRSLIEMMGGELWVESTLNVGSTFSFVIPAFPKQAAASQPAGQTGATPRPEAALLTGPAAAAAPAEPAPPPRPLAPPRRKIVLVVDSELAMHQAYRRHLNKHGYTVEATAAHDRVGDLLQAVQPDIILLDVRTPAGANWSLLERLRSSADSAHIPVIVCTLEPDRARALALGAAAYVAKPFLEETLLAAVRQVDTLPARRNVLLIDGQPESASAIADLLRTKGRCLVEIADDVERGLDTIVRQQPDLLLLNLTAPETGSRIDSSEIHSRLRADPLTHQLPILIIAGGHTPAADDARPDGLTLIRRSDSFDEAELLADIQALLGDNRGGQHSSNGETAA
ncbi:MAG: GAF domain-containing protein [Anaerolineae bacterium]|nr:GAF domain-containing protein [Anaerolineae bacterium]